MRVIKALVLAHWCFNSYAPELVPMIYYRDKTRVQMFYFLSILMHTMGKFSAYGCEVLLTGHSNMPNISFIIHNISWMEYDHINRTGTVYFHEQLIDELY